MSYVCMWTYRIRCEEPSRAPPFPCMGSPYKTTRKNTWNVVWMKGSNLFDVKLGFYVDHSWGQIPIGLESSVQVKQCGCYIVFMIVVYKLLLLHSYCGFMVLNEISIPPRDSKISGPKVL